MPRGRLTEAERKEKIANRQAKIVIDQKNNKKKLDKCKKNYRDTEEKLFKQRAILVTGKLRPPVKRKPVVKRKPAVKAVKKAPSVKSAPTFGSTQERTKKGNTPKLTKAQIKKASLLLE